MAYTEPFQYLINGSYFKAVHLMYYAVIGNWWIILLYVFSVFAAYIGTKNNGITAVISILGALVLREYLPPLIHPVVYLIAAISLAMLLYKAFYSSD